MASKGFELQVESDDYCPDPKLITGPKTSHIQRISSLLGMKDFCRFLGFLTSFNL